MARSNREASASGKTPATVVDISNGKKGLKKNKTAKPSKSRDKTRKIKLSLIIPLMLVLIIAAAAAGFYISTFYFDFFGLRAPIYSFMHNLDPDYSGLAEREAFIAERATELDAFEEQLLTLRDELETQKLQQQKQADEILQAQKNRVPVYRPPINETDREYMEGVGKVYAAMEAENAAEIMVNLYSVEDMAAILYFMSTSKAAAIMESMDPQLAAQITDQWINTYNY